MFSSYELLALQNMCEYICLNSDDPKAKYLKNKVAEFQKLMVEVEKKLKELYEREKPVMDSCGTSLHKIWVMESGFGPSIHLEAFGEHWSFWDDYPIIEIHKHEDYK